ncbi:MAG: MBL fold metallo-hydrolase [Methanobacteriota archaeon]
MFFRQMKLGPMQNFVYLLGDEDTRRAAVVDPAWDVPAILSELKSNGLRLETVLVTHGHPDHVNGVEALADATGAKVAAHASCKAVKKQVILDDDDHVLLGSLEVRVLHTPGHQPDALCFLVENRLFTGDTLFVGECGRTDLPGSDPEAMWASLGRLSRLDPKLIVYPGHDYGHAPSSPLAYELAHNYTLKPRTKEEFVAFMKEP